MVRPVTVIGEDAAEADPVAPPSLDVQVAVYEVMGEPLLAGVANATCMVLLPGVIVGASGGSGTEDGVTGADWGESGPIPTAFVAVTWQV